uniref:hypothetical protein n=1 Tax=Gelidibacter sp. TaxID=2018083 RepID=UPI00404AB962
MKPFILSIIAFFFVSLSYSQQIDLKVDLFGYKFKQNGERLSWSELVTATESHKEANMLIKKAKTNHTVSGILSTVGGVLIGIPIGQSISDKDPNWTLAYIGGGIAVVSIPFTLSAFNKVNEGVDAYNLSLQSTTSNFKPQFNIIATTNGLGLSMNF